MVLTSIIIGLGIMNVLLGVSGAVERYTEGEPSTAAQLGISILAGPGFSVDDSFLVVGVPPSRRPETLDATELSSDNLLRSCSVSSRGSSRS